MNLLSGVVRTSSEAYRIHKVKSPPEIVFSVYIQRPCTTDLNAAKLFVVVQLRILTEKQQTSQCFVTSA